MGLAALIGSVAEISPVTALAAALDRNGVNTVRIFAYRISLEQADDREKLGLVTRDLRLRAEEAERRWRLAREAARLARARSVQSAAQVSRLEQAAAQREAEFAQIIEQLTEELAAKDSDYKRKLAIAITDGTKLLESDEGRRAIELIALGGEKNISAGLDTLDAAAAIADKMDNLRKAERYRQRARVNLGVRGIGSATTGKIIGLFETVVASDPGGFYDWLELVRLYRDANRLQESVKAADNAQKYAANDGERAIAIIERADTYLLQLKNEEMIASFRRATVELVVIKGLGSDRIRELPPEEKSVVIIELVRKFVYDLVPLMVGGSKLAIEDYQKADALLVSAETQMSSIERLRWRAACSLRVFLAYKVNLKIVLIEVIQNVFKEILPAKGTAVTEKDLTNLNRLSSFRALTEKHRDTIMASAVLLQKQAVESANRIILFAKSDDSVQTKLEVISDLTQLITVEDGPIDSNAIERVITSEIENVLSNNPDLVSARRVKANYLFASGIAKTKSDEKSALTLLVEAKTIFDDLAVRDPSSGAARRASAKVLWRLAQIATSGVTIEDALAAYKKLQADSMLAPADEPELAIIEETISLGLPLPPADF